MIPVVEPPPGLSVAERKDHWRAECHRIADLATGRNRATAPAFVGVPDADPKVSAVVDDPDPTAEPWPGPADDSDDGDRPWFADDGTWVA